MRIALVTPEYTTENTFDGGLANYVHRAALALRDMHHEPVIIVPYDADQYFSHEGIEVYRVQTWNPLRNWCKWYSYIDRFDRLTGKFFHMTINLLWRSHKLNRTVSALHSQRPFDVIHYAHLGGLGLFRPKDIPSVTRLSSSTRLCQELGGYGESRFQIRQQERIERKAMRKSAIVFGPSVRVAELTERETGIPVRLIESPFLADVSSSDESLYREHFQGKKYLLFFGSIGLIKGVGTIAAIIHRLLSRHPDLTFAFIGKRLPGQTGGDLMESVWAEAKECPDRVLWFPSQPHEKLYPVIAHAHAVVLPSRIDNFPNACIEAMAFSRIVIGTLRNGFEQLIDDGKSGFLCEPDNPEDLLKTIERALFLEPDVRDSIEHRAQERIRKLAPEHTVSALLDCYLDAIDLYRKRNSFRSPLCAASAAS